MVVPRGVLKDEGVGEEEGGQLEVFAHSVHGTLDLLRMGGHGGETLSHASNEEQANAMADSDGIMMA